MEHPGQHVVGRHLYKSTINDKGNFAAGFKVEINDWGKITPGSAKVKVLTAMLVGFLFFSRKEVEVHLKCNAHAK